MTGRSIIIVQARMTSTRLPGKVLRELLGRPMLAHQLDRLKRCMTTDTIVLATTNNLIDDPIAKLATEETVSCYRGSEHDVLDRFYQAAATHKADLVVRITADCPLIDPDVVDLVVRAFAERQPDVDYASNVVPVRSFPRGLDTEVFSMYALAEAWRLDDNPASREHVTPYLYRHPELFRIHGVLNDLDYSHLRWTVDTPEDFTLIRRIYEHFEHNQFTWREVLTLIQEHPAWADLNRDVAQKPH